MTVQEIGRGNGGKFLTVVEMKDAHGRFIGQGCGGLKGKEGPVASGVDEKRRSLP